jgi:hypothetical protein
LKFAYLGGFSRVPGSNGHPTINVKNNFGGVLADADTFNRRMKLVWVGTGMTEAEPMYRDVQAFREALRKPALSALF